MQIVKSLIEQENARGISTDRIILAGFSQGGAIALFTGLRLTESLAGIIALSTYLPDAESTESERHSANQHTPIFMAHGTRDPVIPIALAEHSRGVLEQMDFSVQWHSYQMEHSVSMGEILDIAKFMKVLVQP